MFERAKRKTKTFRLKSEAIANGSVGQDPRADRPALE
jgi:hypothetical protein